MSPTRRRFRFLSVAILLLPGQGGTLGDPGLLQKVERELAAAVQFKAGYPVIEHDETTRILRKELLPLREKDLKSAWEDYYHLRIDEAFKKIEGRADVEALKLRTLIAFSQDDKQEARSLIEQILRRFPQTRLSPKEFPPKLLNLVEIIRNENKAIGSQPNQPQSGAEGKAPAALPMEGATRAPVNEDLVQESPERFMQDMRLIMKEKRWDAVVFYTVEEIGWNNKITTVANFLKDGQSPRQMAVEFVSVRDIRKAAEILIKKLFDVDSTSTFK